MKLFSRVPSGATILVLCFAAGCGDEATSIPERRPRPVLADVLETQRPPTAPLVAASVGAWKTEQIGFEVGGRVEFVVLRNTEVEGRVTDREGVRIAEGSPVARLESERYELNVKLAEAEVARAEQNLVVAQTNLNETIQAQIKAAEANELLAAAEYKRQDELKRRNAGSQGDLDIAKANWETATSQVKEALASEKAKSAEIKALQSAVLQSEQNLRDAKRNLEDCTLYASFSGLIAETAVVPGSVVTAGAPVATLQMMDPIQVELEVSAEESRRLRRTEIFPVHVTMPDGDTEVRDGFLYQIDTIADPRSRTFTLTLLVLNEKLIDFEDEQVATTKDIWRLDLPFIQGVDAESLFVDEKAILFDETGAYLWQITNATIQNRSLEEQVFTVRKLRVTLLTKKVPYFGDIVFQQVGVDDPLFDPKVHLVTGELEVRNGVSETPPEQWSGTEVYLDSGIRWMLRPGDLVKVDLAVNNLPEGFYVPMDAITRRGGQPAIYVIDETSGSAAVTRTPIVIVDDEVKGATSSLRRIEAVEGQSLEGLKYVTKGVHFLADGESVSVVSQREGSR